MKVVILQSNYIPWKGYFDLINDADIFVFYDEVQYTKNDWRNRNKILTKNGVQWLTIPISAESVKNKISEVLLNDPFWQTQHYKSLSLGYRKSPFFHQLEELINDVYINHKWVKLIDLNRYIIQKTSELLGIKTRFVDSKDYIEGDDKIGRLITVLKNLNASEYITGPAAKDYLSNNEIKFAENNIKLTYKSYPSYPEYMQLQQPFQQYVSIVDMIANIELSSIPNYIWTPKK